MGDTPSSTGKETFEKHETVVKALEGKDVFTGLEKSMQMPFLNEQEKFQSKKSILEDVWEGTPPKSNDPEAVKKHREKQEKYQAALRTDLTHLQTTQDLTMLALTSGRKATPEKIKVAGEQFERNINSVTEARRMALTTILKGIRKTYGDKESRFLSIETNKNEDDIGTKVAAIEEHVWEPPDPKEKENPEGNPLYTSAGLPNFVAISKHMQFLLQILDKDQGIRPVVSKDPKIAEEEEEGRQATRERVQKLLYGLQMIKEMSPIVARRFDAKKALGPDLLVKPAKFAVFSVAVVLGVLSLIPVLKKIFHGENLEASDWPAAAWPAIAIYMGKFLPKGSAGQLETVRDVGAKLSANKPFWTVVEKMGGKDAAIDAVNNAHDLLEGDADKQELLKKMTDQNNSRISEEDLKKFVDLTEEDLKKLKELEEKKWEDLTEEERKKYRKKYGLWNALKNEKIGEAEGDTYRRVFFGVLSDLTIQDGGKRDAALAIIANPFMNK